MARGKFREGMGDIGEGLKEAAPYAAMVPGVGTVAAAGMGAAGGAMERAGQPGANFGSVAGGAAGGAAAPAISGMASGAGSKLMGRGAGAAGGEVSGAATGGAGLTADYLPDLAGGAAENITSMAGQAGVPGAAGAAGGAGAGNLAALGEAATGTASEAGERGRAGRFADWVSDEPELAADIAGTGLEAYGAHRDDRARSREMGMREEDYQRAWGADEGRRRAGRRIVNRRRGG